MSFSSLIRLLFLFKRLSVVTKIPKVAIQGLTEFTGNEGINLVF